LLSKFRTTGFPLSRFSLEITESRLMSNPKKAMEVLGRLLMHNVELSIDDFGTGHSSLKMLREVPFGELKLPNIFVHKAHEDPTLQAIFQTSVQLGKQLRMKTVAEGVETIEDLKCAMESGCDLIQGYLIAKPMKASRIPSWAYEWNKRNQPVKEYPDWSDSVFCDTAGLEYPN
jgi:EAL domain-containing protein (putative c-di-GMP-specific phosphodiesterase class I)